MHSLSLIKCKHTHNTAKKQHHRQKVQKKVKREISFSISFLSQPFVPLLCLFQRKTCVRPTKKNQPTSSPITTTNGLDCNLNFFFSTFPQRRPHQNPPPPHPTTTNYTTTKSKEIDRPFTSFSFYLWRLSRLRQQESWLWLWHQWYGQCYGLNAF